MKTQKLIDLQRERLALHDEARAKLDEIKAATDDKRATELEHEHDMIMRQIDQIALDIDAEAIRAENAKEDRAEREARRPGGEATVAAVDDPRGGNWVQFRADNTGWINDKGEPVRVLGSGERFATERAEGVALGDTVRAMITGARNDLERRALNEGTGSAGGFTVPTPLAQQFIDKMRARMVVNQAGARTVPMESQTLAIARVDGDPTVAWRAEGGSIGVSDPTFGRVLFTAHSLACIVKVSRELLGDTINAGAMIERSLTAAMALELDRAALFGSGSSNQPTGVANMVGINAVSMGTNGALPTYEKMLDAIYELELDNVDMITAGIMHPRTDRTLSGYKTGDGQWQVPPKKIADIPHLRSTSVPINETQGSASNASSVLYGDWRRLLIGMREEIDIRLLTELYAATGEFGVLVHMRADVQAEDVKAFCRLSGITPA